MVDRVRVNTQSPTTEAGRAFLESPDKAPLEAWVVKIEEAARAEGRQEAENMLRRIVAAYHHHTSDDQHRLDDEITGTEHFLAALNASESLPTHATGCHGRCGKTPCGWLPVRDASESVQPPKPSCPVCEGWGAYCDEHRPKVAR